MVDGLTQTLQASKYVAAADPRTIGGASAPVTILDRLRFDKEQTEARLARINAAIEAMERNPGAAEVFEAVSKAL